MATGSALPARSCFIQASGSRWIFSVQDNGPGIQRAFQGRLFEVFKRLHGKEYAGNGLGLSFYKKGIGRHEALHLSAGLAGARAGAPWRVMYLHTVKHVH